MNTKHTNAVESIDKRTIRAATESMTIVALGRGEYKVYSGTRKSYVVDLINETCECPDEEFNHPVDGCKHRQRVCMELGQLPIPDLGRRTDVEIMVGARVGEEPVAIADGGRAKCVECGGYLPDEIEPGTGAYCPQCGHGQHITDGGAVVAPEPQEETDEATHAAGCSDAECEGLDGDAARPVLSFECWEQWAAYDEDQLIEDADGSDEERTRPRRNEPADFGGGESTGVIDL